MYWDSTHLRMIALWQMKPPSTTTSTTTSTNISPPRLHHQFTFTLTTTSDPYGQKLSSTTPMPSATTTLASQSTALIKPTLCIYSICSLKPLMPCRGTLTNRTCAIERPPHWRSACKRVIGSRTFLMPDDPRLSERACESLAIWRETFGSESER